MTLVYCESCGREWKSHNVGRSACYMCRMRGLGVQPGKPVVLHPWTCADCGLVYTDRVERTCCVGCQKEHDRIEELIAGLPEGE